MTGTKPLLLVVCYDIHDDRRRRRVERMLGGHGERVQYSVFEVHASITERDALLERLARLIDRDEDSIRCYVLCGRDVRAAKEESRTVPTRSFDYRIG